MSDQNANALRSSISATGLDDLTPEGGCAGMSDLGPKYFLNRPSTPSNILDTRVASEFGGGARYFQAAAVATTRAIPATMAVILYFHPRKCDTSGAISHHNNSATTTKSPPPYL